MIVKKKVKNSAAERHFLVCTNRKIAIMPGRTAVVLTKKADAATIERRITKPMPEFFSSFISSTSRKQSNETATARKSGLIHANHDCVANNANAATTAKSAGLRSMVTVLAMEYTSHRQARKASVETPRPH